MKAALRALTLPLAFLAAGAGAALGAIAVLPLLFAQPSTPIEAALLDRGRAVARMVSRGAPADSVATLESDVLHWRKGDTVSLLLVVVAQGDDALLRYLLRQGAHVDAAPNEAALCLAARYGHGQVAGVLIEHRAPWMPAQGCDGNGASPLDLAFEGGHEGLARLLRQYRKTLDSRPQSS